MNKTISTAVILSLLTAVTAFANDWGALPVPAEAEIGKVWELQEQASDDFNYSFSASTWSFFGTGNKWYNFYHNGWNGPGTTYWQYNHISVDGSDLNIRASRNPSTSKMGVPGVNAGCITSDNKVRYPAYIEASVSVADITLASDVWLLSPDDTQEIDMIECYGGAYQGNAYFAEYIHISHHSFIRNPFTDYQPRDTMSWWSRPGVNSWGQYCWNGGNRRYVRVGVNWAGPKHFEYYIDGERVRVLYDKALANEVNGQWVYSYPTMTGGVLDFNGGYQALTQHSTSSEYSQSALQAASAASSVSIIDPYGYQGGAGFTKEMDIIINVESQDWHVSAGRTPSDADLLDPAKNTMKVDWIRVYDLVDIEPVAGGPVLDIAVEDELAVIHVTNGTSEAYFNLLVSEDLSDTNGWMVVASNLTFDAVGDAVVSNSVAGTGQIFFKVEDTGEVPPVSIPAMFDWEEFTGQWWSDGYGYVETDNGVSLVHGGRAAAHEDGNAFKAAYHQDAVDGTFDVQIGGVSQQFVVQSIDIMAGTGPAPMGTPMIRGMLDGAEQWAIDPVEDESFNTYTSSTTGDMSLPVDQIIWSAPYDPANPSTLLTWDNAIDNLQVLVETH